MNFKEPYTLRKDIDLLTNNINAKIKEKDINGFVIHRPHDMSKIYLMTPELNLYCIDVKIIDNAVYVTTDSLYLKNKGLDNEDIYTQLKMEESGWFMGEITPGTPECISKKLEKEKDEKLLNITFDLITQLYEFDLTVNEYKEKCESDEGIYKSVYLNKWVEQNKPPKEY